MLKRRMLLKGMAALGLVTATAPLSSCGPGEDTPPEEDTGIPPLATEPQTVYRLQTPKGRVCNACKRHHRYKIFLTETDANLNRAHPGCNCGITSQVVAADYFNGFRLYVRNGVADLRTAFGYTPV